MKTLKEYMKLPYRMEIIPDNEEGGYTVSFPDLPGCLTCAETIEDAVKNAEDAKREWFSAAIEDGYEIPEPSDINEMMRLRLPKTLQRQLSDDAKQEGISTDRYCLYLLTKNSGGASVSP